jgi:hypothetical protein
MRLPGFDAAIPVQNARARHSARGGTAAVPENGLEPALRWGNLEFGTCWRASGLMQIGAVLWDIPWGVQWESTCAATPGYAGRRPDSCVNTGFNIKGWWNVPCTGCCA